MENYKDMLDKICEELARMEEERTFQEMKLKKQIEEAVFICSRHMKYVIQTALPQYDFYILAIDVCEDDKLYMITDKELANNIRQNLDLLKGNKKLEEDE